jgi:hypothetical protein
MPTSFFLVVPLRRNTCPHLQGDVLIIEAVITSEKSISFYVKRYHNIPKEVFFVTHQKAVVLGVVIC